MLFEIRCHVLSTPPIQPPTVLGLCCLLYSQFTTIVSASWADSVVDVVSATVWAKRQCWHFSLVVSTTFRGSGVRLSSFWMCHSCLLFIFVIFKIYPQLLMPRLTTQNCQARHRLPSHIIHPLQHRYRGGLGEVRPFLDYNHHLGDYAPKEDSR